MTGLASGKPKQPCYDVRDQAYLESTSPVLIRNLTIQYLRELSMEMPSKDKKNIVTFDDLIIDMIRIYGERKKLWDPVLNDDDDG